MTAQPMTFSMTAKPNDSEANDGVANDAKLMTLNLSIKFNLDRLILSLIFITNFGSMKFRMGTGICIDYCLTLSNWSRYISDFLEYIRFMFLNIKQL
jgi:hypothetical protein